jgi:hypothetical protein
MIRWMSVFLFASLLACSETPDAQTATDTFGPRPMPNRDLGVRRDAGFVRDMAVVVDSGSVPSSSPKESKSTYFPGEYVAYGTCPETVTYGGQMTQAMSQAPNGGQLLTQPYPADYDGGIIDLLSQVPPPSDDDEPPPVNLDLEIAHVTVVATRASTSTGSAVSQSQGRFWVSDGRGTIEVYLELNGNSTPPFTIQVGQIISFRATEVGRYGDRAQVRRATDWQISEENPHPGLPLNPDGAVSVYEPVGELTVDDVNRIVRVTGLLGGEGDGCGSGHTCWQLDYGTGSATFRTRDDDLRPGTCITYVGPVSSFRGRVQLEPFNSLWARRYQRGNDIGELCEVDGDCTTDLCLRRDDLRECGLPCETDTDCPLRTACTFEVRTNTQNRN